MRSGDSGRFTNPANPCVTLRQLRNDGVDSGQLELLEAASGFYVAPLDADATEAALTWAATALAPPMEPKRFLHRTRGQLYWGLNIQKNKLSFQIGTRADAGFKAAISQFINEFTTPPPEDPLIYAHYRALKALLNDIRRIKKLLEVEGMKTAYVHGYVVDFDGETGEHGDNKLKLDDEDFAACRAIVPSTARPLEFTMGNVDAKGKLILASARSIGTVYGASIGDAKAMGGRDYLPPGRFDFAAAVDDMDAHRSAGAVRIFHTSNRNGATREMIILVFTGSESTRRVTE